MSDRPRAPVAPPNIDAFLPPEMARRAEEIGVKKAAMPAARMFWLAVLAGAFIAFGAVFSTTVVTGTSELGYGVSRLLGGVTFSLGLILVIVGGAELFTGNNLVVMAVASRRVSYGQLLRSWLIVYAGNFVGSVGIAALMFFSRQYEFAEHAVGTTALKIAAAKCQLDFGQAVALGILCNVLVCLAVWLCFSARSTTDKICSILFPISAFVAAGFEHSVANMYFIPMGLLIKSEFAAKTNAYPELTWQNFLSANLLPVTIGNIIGGTLLVGLVYWFIYLKPDDSDQSRVNRAMQKSRERGR